MIKLSNITLPVDYNNNTILSEAAKQLKINKKEIADFEMLRLSVDARKKNKVHYTATVGIVLKGGSVRENKITEKNKRLSLQAVKPYTYYVKNIKKPSLPPIVVGAGPAGLFCGLVLAQAGACPVIIERGKGVEQRQKDVECFWKTGRLNENSNVQFGEGGAGTFSDGKLNTGTKDIRSKKVLQEFVKHGAPKEILYNAKPHIGTDKLPSVVKSIREEIIRLGGRVMFESQLTNIFIKNGAVCAAEVRSENTVTKIDCNSLVLALGHSARDTFEMLNNLGFAMEQKPFSVGARIEHLQSSINRAQYGEFANKGNLGAADYKLAVHLNSGRGVYTFCMCPGGTVVAAASEKNRLVTNGMSKFSRAEKNANSALLVGVSPSDFGSEHILAGMYFQRKLEEQAYILGEGGYKAPVQRVADFMANKKTISFGEVLPSYTAGVTMADINKCLPRYVSDSLKEGILLLNNRLNGFSNGDALLTAVETRSSSPVRILRGDNMQSVGVAGVYPCGEGAGYAGGIMSAAVDGIKCAEAIVNLL